jgi:hypothetical protein
MADLIASKIRPDDNYYKFLAVGQRYRVIRQFIDFDRGVHLPGDEWVFLGASYSPRDEGITIFVSVDGAHEWNIRFMDAPEEQGEILYDLETYVGQVITETYPAPVASEPPLALVTRTPERISALVKSAFAEVRGIDGKVADPANPGGTLSGPPRTFFVPEITPPLPVSRPAECLVYYAYARHHLGAALESITEPWARIESGSEVQLVPLSGQLKSLGTQGVKVLTAGQRLISSEVARAGPLEDLLLAAGRNDAAAALVRRSYCSWKAHNLIAKAVLPWHPEFAAFLDCAHLAIEPVPRRRPIELILPEFYRRWPVSKDHPPVWEMCTTNGFPSEWPVGPKTRIAYYAAAIRYDNTLAGKRPCEVTEPWGVVVRDGEPGTEGVPWQTSALTFTSLTSAPNLLGIEPARPASGYAFQLLRKISELLQARKQGGIDELFMLAAQDPQLAALVGSWYKQWIEDNSLLAAWVLPRHAAFAAFITSAAKVTIESPSHPSGLVKNFY